MKNNSKKYLEDVIVTGLFQVVIGYMGFNSRNHIYILITGITIVLMPILVYLKGKYFYKLFNW